MTLSRTSAATLAAVLAATLAASTTVVVIDAFVVPRQATPFTTTTSTELDAKKRVVVIGNGMVGQRFMEKIFLEDTDPEDVQLSTFCDEPRLELPSPFWYQFEIWLCTRYTSVYLKIKI